MWICSEGAVLDHVAWQLISPNLGSCVAAGAQGLVWTLQVWTGRFVDVQAVCVAALTRMSKIKADLVLD